MEATTSYLMFGLRPEHFLGSAALQPTCCSRCRSFCSTCPLLKHFRVSGPAGLRDLGGLGSVDFGLRDTERRRMRRMQWSRLYMWVHEFDLQVFEVIVEILRKRAEDFVIARASFSADPAMLLVGADTCPDEYYGRQCRPGCESESL